MKLNAKQLIDLLQAISPGNAEVMLCLPRGELVTDFFVDYVAMDDTVYITKPSKCLIADLIIKTQSALQTPPETTQP